MQASANSLASKGNHTIEYEEDDMDIAEFLSTTSQLAISTPSTQPSAAPPNANLVARETTLPRIVIYRQMIHRICSVEDKNVCEPPTLIKLEGAAHPLSSIIVQHAMSLSSSVLALLTNIHYGYCAQVSVAFHEAGTLYEGCNTTENCMHQDIALYRVEPSSASCACLEKHVLQNISQLPPDHMREYYAAYNAIENSIDSRKVGPIRGQPAAVVTSASVRSSHG